MRSIQSISPTMQIYAPKNCGARFGPVHSDTHHSEVTFGMDLTDRIASSDTLLRWSRILAIVALLGAGVKAGIERFGPARPTPGKIAIEVLPKANFDKKG